MPEIARRPQDTERSAADSRDAGAEGGRRSGGPTPGSPALAASEVTLRYPDRRGRSARTIGPASFSIREGSWVALLGPNGSGKSTILRLLSGAASPTEGEIRWFGGRLTHAARRRLGVVFQRPAIDELLTVRETLEIAARVALVPRAEAARRVEEAARRLDVADRLQDRAGTLSGGTLRRVDLARAVIHRPSLLLLDEPTAGLDAASRRDFLDLIEEIHREGVTIVAATHHLDEAERAARAILLSRGRIVADAPPETLRAQLGPRRLVVDADDAWVLAALRERGEVRPAGPGRVALFPAEASPEALGAIAAELTRRGLTVTVGPPTLEDVCRAHEGDGAGDWANPGGAS